MFRLILLLFFVASNLSGSLKVSEEALDASLKEHIHFSNEGENRVGKIVIDDKTSGINASTWIYVKAALDYYKKNPPIFIILELNTPGGEIYSAQLISDALKNLDIQNNIPVVAYINNWAISAGAMLAYSSRYIAAVKDASMGAAEPVIQDATTGEMKTASEKVNSAMRVDFASRAEFFDRNPLIAEAMVDKDIILVLREGKIVKLDREDEERREGPNKDILISPKGKLLTLNQEKMIEYGVADFALKPIKLESLTEEEVKSGHYPAKKEALFQVPFFASIPSASIDEYKMDLETRFFAFLASPIVSSILFIGMLAGFYMEYNSPGFGIPGTIGVACLSLLILSSISQDVAVWYEVILVAIGVLLVVLEIAFFPTFGFLAVVGALLAIIGLFGALLPSVSSVNFDINSLCCGGTLINPYTLLALGLFFIYIEFYIPGMVMGICGGLLLIASLFLFIISSTSYVYSLGFFILILLLLFALIKFALWHIPRIKPGNSIYLKSDQEGYLASTFDKEAIGKEGIVLTDLKPGGYIEVDKKQHAAISLSGYMSAGEKVIVLRGEGDSLIVTRKTNNG